MPFVVVSFFQKERKKMVSNFRGDGVIDLGWDWGEPYGSPPHYYLLMQAQVISVRKVSRKASLSQHGHPARILHQHGPHLSP